MKEICEDFEKEILGDPRTQEIKAAGGVLIVHDLKDLEKWRKTPYVALIDGGTSFVRHLSGGVKQKGYLLNVHVIHKIVNRTDVVQGSLNEDGLVQHLKSVEDVIDMNRIRGKYFSVFLRTDLKPAQLSPGDVFLLEKGLTFEIVRVEIP
jgi:hypothetical protein